MEFFPNEKEETKMLEKKVRSYHVKTKSLSHVDQNNINNASNCSSRTANGYFNNGTGSLPSQNQFQNSNSNWEHQVMILGRNSPPGTTGDRSRKAKSRQKTLEQHTGTNNNHH